MAMDGSSSLLAVLALDSHHDRLLAVVTALLRRPTVLTPVVPFDPASSMGVFVSVQFHASTAWGDRIA